MAFAPEAHGIPSAAVLDLIDALSAEGLDPHTLAIARYGDVVVEAAWSPWTVDGPALSYSASKTFTSLAIGFLEAEGRLGLGDSVGDLLGLPNPHGLTVRHLLTMNTGHSTPQIDRLGFDVRALLSTPPADEPGTAFAYNSDATYALSCIVTALTGERLTDYLRPRLLDPLGIGARWMKPARGVEQGFSGFHITVRDLVRMGIMLGDGGRFDGAQVVPAAYVEELSRAWSDTAEHPNTDAPDDAPDEAPVDNDWALGYGYQVWRGRSGFRLDGAYGQFSVVLPDRGLVIAYQGATLDTQRTMRAFWRFVDAVDAVGDAPLEASTDAALDERIAGLDAWTARATLSAAPDGAVDAAAARLDDAPGGWMLTLPPSVTGHTDGTPLRVAVGADGWTRSVLALPAPADLGDPVVTSPPVDNGTHVAVAARGVVEQGGPDADGILVHVIVPTSPHRLIVRRGADGSISAGWHTVPVQGGVLAALAVPADVAESAGAHA